MSRESAFARIQKHQAALEDAATALLKVLSELDGRGRQSPQMRAYSRCWAGAARGCLVAGRRHRKCPLSEVEPKPKSTPVRERAPAQQSSPEAVLAFIREHYGLCL